MKTINSFKNLVSQKSCVVVAPSYFLKGRQLGTLIDKFDIVAKCNDFYEHQENSDHDLGSRCEIWYGLPQQSSYQFNFEKCKRILNPKHLRIQSRLPSFDKFWDQTISSFEEKNRRYKFDYSVIDEKWYQELTNELKCIPMTGILAIMDLLYNGASKVHALGFDFLRSGYYNEKAIDLHVLQSGWHNTSNLKRFLHDLLGKEKRFSADPHLKSILDSEFSSNFDLEKTFNLNLKNECKKFLHPYSQQPLLLIRSSNRFSFDKTLSLIRNFNENPPIHIISSSENSTDSNELKIYFHPSLEKKISPRTLKDLDVLKKLQFQYCIIFYNGKGLHEYLNIFEILNHLKCSTLFLLSELGFLRKVLDIKQTISEINEFLAKKERFDYLNSKYNRENCI